jgi:RNA polymerase sigma-70 factor (ECF subfamily)
MSAARYAVLIRAAQAGDRSAMERLLADIAPLVHGYCRSRLFSGAEDAAQDALLGVLASLPSYREQGRFLSWVLGITHHKVVDHIRAAVHRNELVPQIPDRHGDPARGPEQLALDGEAERQLAPHLRSLTPRSRRVVALRVVAGLSGDDTAALLGSTRGSVLVTQHRALKALRERLSDDVRRTGAGAARGGAA